MQMEMTFAGGLVPLSSIPLSGHCLTKRSGCNAYLLGGTDEGVFSVVAYHDSDS